MSKSPSIRRIKADIRELSIDPSDQYTASPLEHDMFEWHFTIRGAEGTDFEGGVYHGRILLPPEYPFKPPNIVFLTPSGRFECGVKVCLSFSAHHPELWQPAWGIRLILEALISFLPTLADGALGALDWTSAERKKLAKESVNFRCPICCAEGETCADLLPEVKKVKGDNDKKKTKFQEEIKKLKMLQFQNHAVEEEESAKKKEGGDGNDEKKDDFVKEGVEEQEKNTSTQAEEGAGNVKPSPTLPPQQPEKNEPSTNLKPEEDKDTKEGSTEKPKTKVSSSVGERGSENTTTVQLNTTPPPAQTNNNAAPAPQRVRPPAVAPPAAINNNNFAVAADAPIVSDSLLNGMIGFFAVIVIVLLRQSQALVDELQRLGRDD